MTRLAAYVATTFEAMVKQTPALHAHLLEIQDRLARVPPNSSPCRRGSSPPIPSRRSPAGRLSAWTRSTWTRGYVTSAPAGAALNCATRSPSTYAKPRDWTGLASLSRGTQIGGATARDNSGRDGHRLTRGRQRSLPCSTLLHSRIAACGRWPTKL